MEEVLRKSKDEVGILRNTCLKLENEKSVQAVEYQNKINIIQDHNNSLLTKKEEEEEEIGRIRNSIILKTKEIKVLHRLRELKERGKDKNNRIPISKVK